MGSRRMLDVSRAEREFGFRAEMGFDEGLKRTVEWHSNNIEMLTEIAYLGGKGELNREISSGLNGG